MSQHVNATYGITDINSIRELERQSEALGVAQEKWDACRKERAVEERATVSKRDAEETRDIRAVGTSRALTSGEVPPLWQVPLSLLEAAARRYKKGNDKSYPIHNWRGGLDDPAFLRDRTNHAATHLMRAANGDNSVDDVQGNVDAVVWWCAMMCEAIRLHPEAVAAAFYDEPRGEKTC